MENTFKWISPKSATGSMVLALLAHASIYLGVLILMRAGFEKVTEPVPMTEEIAYETFAEPPAPAEVARPVARTPDPEVPKEAAKQTDTSPKELQDDKGVVSGTQTAAKPVASTGAQGVGDAVATPYYKIKPRYPRAALVSGIEGSVTMKIDVNENGEVENIRITGGQQKTIFQDEARRAVEKWKYKPFLDANGKPIRKTDHSIEVDFKLQDASS
jgi:protein TonB